MLSGSTGLLLRDAAEYGSLHFWKLGRDVRYDDKLHLGHAIYDERRKVRYGRTGMLDIMPTEPLPFPFRFFLLRATLRTENLDVALGDLYVMRAEFGCYSNHLRDLVRLHVQTMGDWAFYSARTYQGLIDDREPV